MALNKMHEISALVPSDRFDWIPFFPWLFWLQKIDRLAEIPTRDRLEGFA